MSAFASTRLTLPAVEALVARRAQGGADPQESRSALASAFREQTGHNLAAALVHLGFATERQAYAFLDSLPHPIDWEDMGSSARDLWEDRHLRSLADQLDRKVAARPFDFAAAEQARTDNPALTPYDTGEMLQPNLHVASHVPIHSRSDAGHGLVDFDDDEGSTQFTLFAHPSRSEDDCITLQIDPQAVEGHRMKIVLGEQIIFIGMVG